MTGPDQPRGDVAAFFDELRALLETTRTCDMDTALAAGFDVEHARATLASLRQTMDHHVVDDVRMQAGLRSGETPGGSPGLLPDLTGSSPEEFFPYSPIIGPRNAMAPPFRFWIEADEIRGTGRFRSIHNGPPGGAHGGMVAALLDEVMGLTGVATGNHGFTGTLTVRYTALTPLDAELTVRGWVTGSEGRKTTIAGEVHHGETLCARGDGVFISPA